MSPHSIATTVGQGLVIGTTLALNGCASSPEPAATVALTRQPEEPVFVTVLDANSQHQLRGAFDLLAVDRRALTRPVVSPHGRWSDVYSAALFACDVVEMAIVGKSLVIDPAQPHAETWVFQLRTVEDWPGKLTVRRIDDVSESAICKVTAQIGHFGDRVDRANALIDAFERQLIAFGRKPRLPP